MMKGLFSLPDRWAAASQTAYLAFCASVCVEKAQWGGGVWPGEGLYGLRDSVREGELLGNQASGRAAG